MEEGTRKMRVSRRKHADMISMLHILRPWRFPSRILSKELGTLVQSYHCAYFGCISCVAKETDGSFRHYV